MADKEKFIEQCYIPIQRLMSSEARKYSPSAFGYGISSHPGEWVIELTHDFLVTKFISKVQSFWTIFTHQGEGALKAQVRISIRHFLTDKMRSRYPLGRRVYNAVLAAVKDMADLDVGERPKARVRWKGKPSRTIEANLLASVLWEEFHKEEGLDEEKDDAPNVDVRRIECIRKILMRALPRLDGWCYVGNIANAIVMLLVTKSSIGGATARVLEEGEVKLRLDDAINSLSQRQQRILELMVAKDYTFMEISKVLATEGMGCDESTVKREWDRIHLIFDEAMQEPPFSVV